jgi:maltooligosyltrehalose trehalohydrolase
MNWGPTPLPGGGTRFALWAPGVDALTLDLDGRDPLAMTADADGWFSVDTDVGPGARYRFRLPDGTLVPDAAARLQGPDVHDPSVVVDLAYDWRHPDWKGRPWAETVIYEAHVGAMGGYAGVAAALPRLAALGITAIELMPLADFSGTRNWGYDGVLPFAPDSSYGTPEELKALIDLAHGHGLMMFLDVVYNHFGPDGNYIAAYAPDFFKPDVPTPWGPAIAFARAPVARFFLNNARYWLTEYRFDGLRFDAVHAIGDPAFLDRLAAETRAAVGPDRHVHLMLENEENDAARLERGYDAQWNDDFHNVLHVLLTDEHQAYYADFADRPAERLARCLAQGFIYQGEGSANHDGKPRGTPSGHLPPTRFIAFLQNHDQVGNRAMGDRLTTLVSPDRLRAATGLLLLCPQIPMLFMGDEVGSQSPFLFFTDFHDELADAVRNGRRAEFAKFPAFADPDQRARIPDPNAAQTFAASRPAPGPDADAWTTLYATLLDLRHGRIVPNLANCTSIGAEVIGTKAVVARWQLDEQVLTLALNLGAEPVRFVAPADAERLVALGDLAEDNLAPASFAAWIGA